MLAIRPLAGPQELDLFLRLAYSLDHELADDLATGRRLPEWMWVALDGDRLLGRLAWWTHAAGAEPQALDFFDLAPELSEEERADVGLRLLETATAAVVPAGARRPEYGRFLPADWREVPETRAYLEALFAVLERSGARPSWSGCAWSGGPAPPYRNRRGAWSSVRCGTARTSSP